MPGIAHQAAGAEARQEKMAETRAGPVMLGPIRDEELSALFDLFADIVARGDGFPHEPPLTAEMFAATWVDTVSAVVVARLEQIVAGAYYLKPNFVGRAAHIANAGYVVSPAYRRSGIGRVLVEDSIWRAPLHGFDAVQFNLVFTSNPARVLYEELGWQVVGTLPRAVDGEDCLVYWRAVGRGS